ncbi:Acyl carrier protein phosphodiesterase [Modicisalibacter ilicicola DSM 19980]|uniref:Acyl carrier protein phosphodiesterase n=1 Tax=Modicisalibacter ilicicola DSM 19980 TaxID=1121942 RepID=A0A1M5E112_9GAMM|nr:ACP phosphodiesterase [Halomonas ilicicola]SHF72856.1 Acyl carrier protein phosphodiesterase [Halomonas ilicicola DSM 19980]
MNFLAHACLARGGSDAFLYGNLIADGVKGSDLGDWPGDVAAGIRHHRRVDAVVDSHPIVLAARARAPCPGRRYAGIALDLVWDHFVARDHGPDRRNQALIRRCYRLLEERPAPARLANMVPVLIEQDWLNGYADFEFTCAAVAGVGRRLRGPNRLAELIPWLEADYVALEQDFARLWPELNHRLGL